MFFNVHIFPIHVFSYGCILADYQSAIAEKVYFYEYINRSIKGL